MNKYRVAITVILDPVEANSNEEAEEQALRWVEDTLSSDSGIPSSVSQAMAIGSTDYDGLVCLIRGSVLSEPQ